MAFVRRALSPFPIGDNSSDTIVNGVHFNLTTLTHWNYTYYSNNTFSNGSRCYLVFEPYIPRMLENGTFLNSTSCYSPIRPIQARSKIGLVFAALFSVSIVFTLTNLRKHGRLFLPIEKRFLPVGRRWQWYWMLVVAVFGIISSVMNIDVDRYYLPELPLALSSLFWSLMLPITMCIVWESIRHWGSWQERQTIDESTFMLSQHDLRSKVETCIPLLLYLLVVVNILLVLPRSWGSIELQRDPEQTRLRAEPSATDMRFKLAAFILLGAWGTSVFSLWHSIKHYKLRNRSTLHVLFGTLHYVPPKFMLSLGLSLVMIGYEVAYAFEFSISPLNLHANLGMMYGLGWSTIVLIFVVYEVSGYIEPNEDRELIRQRRLRHSTADRAISIAQKPHWWFSTRSHPEPTKMRTSNSHLRNEDRGEQLRSSTLQQNTEMPHLSALKARNGHKPVWDADIKQPSHLLSTKHNTDEMHGRIGESWETSNVSSMAGVDGFRSRSTSATTTLNAQPQQIRSMLDV